MLLENKNAVIYGWGEFISGAVARPFAGEGGEGLPRRLHPRNARRGAQQLRVDCTKVQVINRPPVRCPSPFPHRNMKLH
jgi:hypothetical protein